jgi:hypothetical protein
MKSYSDAVPDTNKFEELEQRLTQALAEKELSLATTIAAGISNVKHSISATDSLITVVMIIQLMADLFFTYKLFH